MSPVTYHRRYRIAPWVALNINRKSWSVTIGPEHGPHYTWSSTGTDTVSADLPGKGLGYRKRIGRKR